MDKYKIALCGTPMVGKGTLILEIGRITGFKPAGMRSETEPNTFLTIKYQGTELQFTAGCGSYLSMEPMIHVLLQQASMVIYVLSPAYDDNNRPNHSDVQHRRYLDLYLHHAQHLGVGWEDVPWLLVLNKTDLAQQLPIEAASFPESLRQNHIRCVASQGIGISDVWKRTIELLRLPSSP